MYDRLTQKDISHTHEMLKYLLDVAEQVIKYGGLHQRYLTEDGL
jgi:hypothetical protein